MSSTHVRVLELINILEKFPEDMMVVIQDGNYDREEHFEGFFNGPKFFHTLPVQDVRTGMNYAIDPDDTDWQVLCISCSSKESLIVDATVGAPQPRLKPLIMQDGSKGTIGGKPRG